MDILFEKYIFILAWEMASPGNQHCANCIGTLSFPILCLLKTTDLHSLKKSGAVFLHLYGPFWHQSYRQLAARVRVRDYVATG